jgi:DNA-binding PadR family transcriptional regulator
MGQLGPLSVAVLGLLAGGPLHPYEVSFRMRQQHLDRHIKLNFGSLYHTFDQLQRQGLIEPMEVEREGRRPERTVYQLTPEGRDAFLERVRHMVLEPQPVYSDFEAGLAFIHHLDRDQAARLLLQRASALEREHLAHEEMLHGLAHRGLSRLALIEVELAQEMRKHQAGWCRRIADEIESGELEWYAGYCEDLRPQLSRDKTEVASFPPTGPGGPPPLRGGRNKELTNT